MFGYLVALLLGHFGFFCGFGILLGLCDGGLDACDSPRNALGLATKFVENYGQRVVRSTVV